MLRSSLILSLLVLLLAVAPAAAENFRMETDVFVGNQKKPICQTLTLFTETMVYDFIYGPGDAKAKDKDKDDQQITEATVFDMSAGRVILLDMKQNKKTVLTHEQLVQLTTSMKVNTTEKDAIYHFAAHPVFSVNFDEPTSLLTLSSPSLSYTAKTQKADNAAAAWRYQEFADWSARLNACRPGNLPPFARMELGKAMADRSLLPEEITRTMVAPGRLGNKKVEMRSRHMVNWLLSSKDRKRIAMVAEQIGTYESVAFMAFVEPEKTR